MMLIDANLLLFAYHSAAKEHLRAKEWLEAALESGEPVGLAADGLLAFLRITTSPALFAAPFTMEEAASIAADWLSHPAVSLLHPTERHWGILSRLLIEGQARGPLIMDAHVAALAIEHGATLWTTDRDFMRFKGLRVSNPLD